MMKLLEKSQNTKETQSELKKVDFKMLQELCKVAQHKLSPVGDYVEIHNFLRNSFKIDCTLDEVVKVYTLEICEIENSLLYKQYGY